MTDAKDDMETGELERMHAIQAVHCDLKRTLDYLDAVTDRVARMRGARFKKRGKAQVLAYCIRSAHECVERASNAIDVAADGGPLWQRFLEAGRHFSWIAATRAGAAVALSQLDLPGARPRSRTAKFLKLLDEHNNLSAARVNALLLTPLDEATARRIAREHRGRRAP